MNTLSPLGLITCFVLSIALNGGTTSSHTEATTTNSAYITNYSKSVIYFMPESKKANPGLLGDGAYPVMPGQSLYQPFDAIVTARTTRGNVFRLPTGSRVIVDEEGNPQPANLIARVALLLPPYGDVQPPYSGFAKLANPKQIIYKLPDVEMGERHAHMAEISGIARLK